MKKKLIILWPWYFKKKDWLRYEIDYFLKYKDLIIEVHELGNNIEKKLVRQNLKHHKIIKKFRSIDEWFDKIKKTSRKYKIFILNDVRAYNFQSYKVKKKLNELKLEKKIKILEYLGDDTPEPIKQKLSSFILIKKIFSTNPILIITSFKIKLFQYLERKLNYFPNFSLLISDQKQTVNKKSKKIFAHSLDYYNNLLKNRKLNFKKKYAIYIDYPLPDVADTNYLNWRYPITLKKWFKSLNSFFLQLEKKYNCEILIFPHPKNKKKQLKKYYSTRKIVYKPISEFSQKTLFFICRNTTAISFPVIYNKPIFLICSDELFLPNNYKDMDYYNIFKKELSLKVTNIDHLSTKDITKINLINYKSYQNFEQKYLTSKKSLLPNNKIIYKTIKSK